MEELAFRRHAEILRGVRKMMDSTKYNARDLSRDHANRIATVYGKLTVAAQELEKVADEIEEAKWGKEESAGSKASGKLCGNCGKPYVA